MFTIGEFSKITGMTVKTLRYYHEEGLLVPTQVDPQSGYRYYDAGKVELARILGYLRALDMPLAEIRELLAHAEDEARLLDALERQKAAIEARVRRYRKVVRSLDQFIADARQTQDVLAQAGDDVCEKDLPPMLVAGIRMRGRYSDCGKGFARLGRAFGRYICGQPLLLLYDDEYREEDADFEPCMPIRQAKTVDGIHVRELPAIRCATLLHKGPYDAVGPTYARIFRHLRANGLAPAAPCREVYIKGPGMIFKGNPKNYLTEIQVPVGD